MSNVQVAIDFVTQNIPRTNPGGVIAFPMFPGATKKEVDKIWKTLQRNNQIAHIAINQGFAMIRIK
jgi:hypothetical protein